jgi:hypothetical protein
MEMIILGLNQRPEDDSLKGVNKGGIFNIMKSSLYH